MKLGLLVVAILGLSGCAYKGDVIRYAAEANDTAVADAEFVLCRGASVGSIRRAYGTPDRTQVWKDLCLDRSDFDVQQ